MKYLQHTGISLLLCTLCSLGTFAQKSIPLNEPDKNRPSLFSNLPDRIPVDISTLRNLFNAETGKDVSLRLGAGTGPEFAGKVISRADDNSFHSIVIRSGNFNGATLTLSSSTQTNGAVRFTGRIISFHHGDAYILQNQDDNYILVKKNFYDLINE
jgi:hypothetical protein